MSIMHIAKIAISIFVTPMLAVIALFAQGYGFVAQLFNPTISVPEFSKSFGDDVVTAKDVAVYMQDEIASFKEFDRFDLAVSEIFMDLEENGRGVVRVTVSERNAEKPIVVLAELDTEKREFYQFADYGREGKTESGWCIGYGCLEKSTATKHLQSSKTAFRKSRRLMCFVIIFRLSQTAEGLCT